MSLCDRVNLGILPASSQLEGEKTTTIVSTNRAPSGEMVATVGKSRLQVNPDPLIQIHNVLSDKSIKKCDFFNFFKVHLEELDEESITALWYELAIRERKFDITFQDPDLEIVINHTRDMLNNFKINQISIIAAAFANLGCENRNYFQRIRDKVISAVDSEFEFDGKDLINILKAFVSVSYDDNEFIQSITSLLANKLQDQRCDFDKYDILDMTITFYTIGLNFHTDGFILSKLTAVAVKKLNRTGFFEPHEIVSLFWYFAKFGIVSEGFANAVNLNLQLLLRQPDIFDNQEIAKITWALSRYPNLSLSRYQKLSLEVRILLEKNIIIRLEQHVDDAFSGDDLYCIMIGLCRIKSENYLLFNLLGKEVLSKLHIDNFFCSQSIAYIFFNFTALSVVDFKIVDRLVQHIHVQLQDPEFFNSSELALIISALSHVAYRYNAYINPIMHVIKEKLLIDNFFDEQQLASLAYSCISLNYKDDEFWDALIVEIENKMKMGGNFNQTSLVNMTLSLVLLDQAHDNHHLIHTLLTEIYYCYDDKKISDVCLIKHLQIRAALKAKAPQFKNPWGKEFNSLLGDFERNWIFKQIASSNENKDIFKNLEELFKTKYPDSVFKKEVYELCHFNDAVVELNGLKIGIEVSNVGNDRNLQQSFMQEIFSKYDVLRNMGWSYIVIERSTWIKLSFEELCIHISKKIDNLMNVEDPLLRDFKELALIGYPNPDYVQHEESQTVDQQDLLDDNSDLALANFQSQQGNNDNLVWHIPDQLMFDFGSSIHDDQMFDTPTLQDEEKS